MTRIFRHERTALPCSQYAAFGANQPQGKRYQALLKVAADELWSLAMTWPCIVEASYLLDPPQRYAMLRWVAAGAISVFPFAQESVEPMVELMRRFSQPDTEPPRSEMDFADASLVPKNSCQAFAKCFS